MITNGFSGRTFIFSAFLQLLWIIGLLSLIPAVAGWFDTGLTDVFYQLPTRIDNASPLWSKRFVATNLFGLAIWVVWIIGSVIGHVVSKGMKTSDSGRTSLSFGKPIFMVQVLITVIIAVLAVLGTLFLSIDVSNIPR